MARAALLLARLRIRQACCGTAPRCPRLPSSPRHGAGACAGASSDAEDHQRKNLLRHDMATRAHLSLLVNSGARGISARPHQRAGALAASPAHRLPALKKAARIGAENQAGERASAGREENSGEHMAIRRLQEGGEGAARTPTCRRATAAHTHPGRGGQRHRRGRKASACRRQRARRWKHEDNRGERRRRAQLRITNYLAINA